MYNNMLIKHMSEGKSLDAFAGEVGVSIEDIHKWVDAYVGFGEAYDVGYAKYLLFWENKVVTAGREDNSQLIKLFMVNKFNWKSTDSKSEKAEKLPVQILWDTQPVTKEQINREREEQRKKDEVDSTST